MRLKSITFDSTDEQLVIEASEIKAKSFTGAERKMKDEDVVAIVRKDNDTFLVFIESKTSGRYFQYFLATRNIFFGIRTR